MEGIRRSANIRKKYQNEKSIVQRNSSKKSQWSEYIQFEQVLFIAPFIYISEHALSTTKTT